MRTDLLFPAPRPVSSPPAEVQVGFIHSEIPDLRPLGQLIEYWCVVAVAEELHFTRAAKRLHIDQSALSRHIQKLESNLGLKLFIRGERRIELTEAGEVFIPFAKKALLAARAGVRIAQAVAKGEPQEFEIAYCPFVDTHLIAEMRALVESARPPVPVCFRSVGADQLMKRLLDGISHAAITLLPVEEEVASACVLREDLFLVVPQRHLLARCSHVNVGEIADAAVIWPVGAMPPPVTNDLFSRLRKFGYVPNISHEAQTVAESLGLAREGLGVTFIKSSDRALVGDGLKAIPLAARVTVETGLLHIRETRWEFLRAFVALVKSRFACEDRVQETMSGSS